MPPFYANLPAVSLPHGTLLSPGGRVAAYVRATARNDDPPHIIDNRVTSINEACKRVRDGQSDTIVVLEGHTENIAGADAWSNIKAGTKIISAGVLGATNNPTLTWTATASQLLIDVANVTIAGLTMNQIGIDAVVLPISVTAAGFVLSDNLITLQDATKGVLKGMELAVGASGHRSHRNVYKSLGEAKPLTSAVVLISGACDDVEIYDSTFAAANPGTSVLGHVAITAAATNVRVRRNTFIQLETAGTSLFVFTVGDVAASGDASDNRCKIGSAVTTTTSGFTTGTAAQVAFGLFDNKTTDAGNVSGALSPVAST